MLRVAKLVDPAREFTLKVQCNRRFFTVEVTTDGEGVVPHAGAGLLAEVADTRAVEAASARSDLDQRQALVRDHDTPR